jgi:CRISPR type I-E-associated protein CasB/Cse2
VSQEFIHHLSRQERAGRAHLRQILQHSLETPPRQAMRIVGVFADNEVPKSPREQAFYLVAGLYALCHPDPFESPTTGNPFAEVAAKLTLNRGDFDPTKTSSLEQRFLSLLDCERSELPYPLRQWVQLVKAASLEVDWATLVNDVAFWGDKTRDRWGRTYYRALHRSNKNDSTDNSTTEETK